MSKLKVTWYSLPGLICSFDDISGTIFKEAHVKVSGLPRSELSYFVSNKDYMTYLKCHDLYAQFSSKTNMESFKCLKEISDYKSNPYVSMVKGWLDFQNIWMGTSKDSDIDMKLARDIAEKRWIQAYENYRGSYA